MPDIRQQGIDELVRLGVESELAVDLIDTARQAGAKMREDRVERQRTESEAADGAVAAQD